MKKLITCLVVCVLSGATFADTWTVDDDGKADFDNIQAAVDAASDGDEIIVMPGTYTKKSVGSVVTIDKQIWLHSVTGSTNTIIDAENAHQGILILSNSKSSIIEGFTIKNGVAENGGGVRTWGDTEFRSCVFKHNWTYDVLGSRVVTHQGGAISIRCGDCRFYNCLFLENTSLIGSAVYSYPGCEQTQYFENCAFLGNWSAEVGIIRLYQNYGESSSFINCVFAGNEVDYINEWTGVISTSSGPENGTIVTNSHFCDNLPNSIGGFWIDGGGNTWDQGCEINEWGACCYGSSCVVTTSSMCVANNGVYIGDGTHCASTPCTTGACCVDTACSVTNHVTCIVTGGYYLGDNTNCNGDPCYIPPTGACCINTSCSIMTASDCSASGGTYLGDNTNCNEDPCYIPPTGACCINTSCSIMTSSDCSASGGTYSGDNTNCDGDPCNSPPAGACCVEKSTCLDIPESNCNAVGGTYLGDNTNCVGNPCVTGTALQWGGNGHWYLEITNAEELQWDEARIAAEEMGGHLVTITSLEENEWFRSNIENDQGPWIGAFNYDEVWMWVDGSEWSYEYWHTGNPDPNECCPAVVSLWNAYRWQDHPVGDGTYTTRTYIVEWSADCNGDGIIDYGQILDGTLIDNDGNGIPDECVCPDINGDGYVNVVELLTVIDQWGQTDSIADLNFDGIVNVSDMLIVISNWGECE